MSITDQDDDTIATGAAARPARGRSSWPRVDDPRNIVLNDLRKIHASRVYLDMSAGTVLALRTIRNVEVPIETDPAPQARAVADMADEFGWPKTGLVLLHLRTMRPESVTEVPEATDPSVYDVPEPAPGPQTWPEADEDEDAIDIDLDNL